jgi:hypothetical protein
MRNPSPRDLRTRPPNAATCCCTIAACKASMSSGVLIATCLPQLGRADDVGHHDRERVCCAAPIRQGLPPICYSAADLPFKRRRRV